MRIRPYLIRDRRRPELERNFAETFGREITPEERKYLALSGTMLGPTRHVQPTASVIEAEQYLEKGILPVNFYLRKV